MPSREIRRVAAIDYHPTPYDWVFAREEAARIDAFWDAALAEKPALFDGRVLVAHRVSLHPGEGGRLSAEAFETGYKPFLAWREFGFPGAPVSNLFAMGALRSADGAYMLGRMGAGTTSAGKLYFPAGTPEPSDIRDGRVDLEGNILRELEEETGIAPGAVVFEPSWTLVFDDARLACMRGVRSALDAEAMVERFAAFRATQADPELDALVPVRSPDDLDAARMPEFMLMFLRDAFARGKRGAA